jgi:protease I
MANRLVGKKIALLIEEDYEDSEVTVPINFLMEEGANVKLIGSGRASEFVSRNGVSRSVHLSASDANPSDFDAFVIPGGYAPEKMRFSEAMVRLIADADDKGKFIAAIGRGPQLLISAYAVKDRMMTCYAGIVIDLKNAGAFYVDDSAVRDGNIITSRNQADLTDFLETLTDALSISTPYIKNVWAGA